MISFTIESACEKLGIKPNASDSELKKAFKKQAAIYHPDKKSGDDNKFKEINSAYQYLKEHGTIPNMNIPGFEQFNDIFKNHKNSSYVYNPSNIYNQYFRNQSKYVVSGDVALSFEESILGCKKEVLYNETVRCKVCKGENGYFGNDSIDCYTCGGKGVFKVNDGADGIKIKCATCAGGGRKKVWNSCKTCKGTGEQSEKIKVIVQIPPGVQNGYTLKVKYNEIINVYIVKVKPDLEMKIENKDVISIVEVSLLEALKGTNKDVRTIKGIKPLKLPPNLKNRDSVRVKGHGVPPFGSHIFIVNIKYPEDTTSIINFLEKEMLNGEQI